MFVTPAFAQAAGAAAPAGALDPSGIIVPNWRRILISGGDLLAVDLPAAAEARA